MSKKFLNLMLVDGSRLLLNFSYITQITPTHGDDFTDGADVVFISMGESGVLQASVPASQVDSVLKSITNEASPFVDLKVLSGQRIILNEDYITHIAPTYGSDLADGADISIWGSIVQIPASSVKSLAKLVS